MSIEVSKADRLSASPERLGSSGSLDLADELLAGIEDGTKPSGRNFVDVVRDDPASLSTILDAICEATGADPKDAIEVAELFDFNSVEEVEYFFANLT